MMKKTLFLFFGLLIFFTLPAQEGPKPELSKKELRKQQRQLKKLNKSLKKKVASLESFLAENNVISNLAPPDLNTDGATDLLNADSLLLNMVDLPDGKAAGILKEFNELKSKLSGLDSSQATAGLNGFLAKLKAQKPDLDTASLLPFLKQLTNDKLPDLNLVAWKNISKDKLPEITRLTGLSQERMAGLAAAQKEGLPAQVPGKGELNLDAVTGMVDIKELAFLTEMKDEIALLKEQLKIGKKMTKEDIKTNAKLQESMMELTDMEYELGDLEELKGQLNGAKLDSSSLTQYLDPINEDLAGIKGQVGDYQQLMDEYKSELVDWDQTLEEEIVKLEEVEKLKVIVENKPVLPDPKQQVDEAQKTIEKGFQSKEYVNNLIKERFNKLLEEEGPDALVKRLEKGHEKLAEYKQNYDQLQYLDGEEPRRQNPLKEKTLGERLFFGGNLQVNRQRPLTLDAGLEMGYMLTPNSEWGLGGAYRLKLEKGVQPGTITDLFNIRSFYHHRVWKSIGIQTNYELNYGLPRTEQVVEGLAKQWIQSGLIGLRNEQPFFKKIGGYVTFQYDFLHQPESPNPKWVFRFGFRLRN